MSVKLNRELVIDSFFLNNSLTLRLFGQHFYKLKILLKFFMLLLNIFFIFNFLFIHLFTINVVSFSVYLFINFFVLNYLRFLSFYFFLQHLYLVFISLNLFNLSFFIFIMLRCSWKLFRFNNLFNIRSLLVIDITRFNHFNLEVLIVYWRYIQIYWLKTWLL